MTRIRLLVVLVSAGMFGILAAPARGEGLLPGLPRLCLPHVELPILPCPPPPAGGSPSAEPRPVAVTPTTVRYDSRRIIVRFKRRTRASAIDAAFARARVRLDRKLARTELYVAKAADGRRDQALASLRRERSVERLQREVLVSGLDTTPNDPSWPDQWGLRTMGFTRAWDVTRGSKSVVIAVLDTGLDSSHPELKGAVVPGRDIVHGDNDPADDNGHGTAAAGVIAARGHNGVGIAGACWECLVMPVQVLGADGTGKTSDVAAGIIWAVDHGARVINMSLGAPGVTEAMTEAIDYAASKDAVIVAAAGNSSSTTPFYPAADNGVISVAASNPDDQLYTWSNHGPWVEIAAPGCNGALWLKGGYVSFCGTSSAAPLVAGLAALVRSARSTATAAETVQTVYGAVDQMSGDVHRGRVNAGAALAALPTSDAGPAGRRTTTVTLRGRLHRRARSRTHRRLVGAGRLDAVLRFPGARRLSLLLVRPNRPISSISGKSPLRLSQALSDGPIALVVKRRRRNASYRLTLSYSVP